MESTLSSLAHLGVQITITDKYIRTDTVLDGQLKTERGPVIHTYTEQLHTCLARLHAYISPASVPYSANDELEELLSTLAKHGIQITVTDKYIKADTFVGETAIRTADKVDESYVSKLIDLLRALLVRTFDRELKDGHCNQDSPA